MKARTLIILALLATLKSGVYAQQWGLYTFYATKNGTQAFLIDTNSTTYHTWTFSSSKKSAYSAYLIPGDTIVRSYKPSGAWSGGGITGGIQKVAWDGTVTWDWTYYATNDYCLHHDICPLPNGNVLMISYDYRSAAEATQAGSSSNSVFWSEKIIEVHQTGPTTGVIVWEWYLWDHLCQNYNAAKDNYVTSIVNNPQLMNINYAGSGMLPDRYHMNGIDYNEELDQIVVSMHFMNSAFVIDHSTTTAEAAGHTGGNSGKGGDFLYRWGNPASYGATGSAVFDVIHDAHWVDSDNPNYPDYLCGYNNEGGTGGKTAVTIWQPPYNGYNYSLTLGSAYAPASYAYQYNSSFTASNEGNSQQLPNGNMIVNNAFGSIYEVNASGTSLWTKASANSTHAYRFSLCEIRGPVAIISADQDICTGDAVILNGSSVSPSENNPTITYSWTSNPAGFTSTNQSPSVTPSSTTTYTLVATNASLGCSSSAEVIINVHPQPANPIIIQSGNDLVATAASTYQWYLDGTIINGATAQTYTPLQSGSYTVVITDDNGCDATSDAFNIIVDNINFELGNDALILTPNPSNGIATLSGIMVENDEYYIDIMNTFGQIIQQYSNTHTIDLSSEPDGLYFIIVRDNQNITLVKKMIKHQ